MAQLTHRMKHAIAAARWQALLLTEGAILQTHEGLPERSEALPNAALVVVGSPLDISCTETKH